VKEFFQSLDRRIRDRGTRAAWEGAALGVVVVGSLDYLTGYEISMSLFYLAPVSLAAWYGGRRAGLVIAVVSCASWYLADLASGHTYSHPAIPVWNAAVRLGFFAITAILLAAVRELLLQLWHLARTDALTGLAGRRAFEERLEHDLALAQRHGTALTLVYLDVDDFKAVNDTHGHARGDRLLELAGRTLRAGIRRADTAARLGGDEFALILPDTDERGARHVVQELSRKLQEALAKGGFRVSCSLGAMTFTDPTVSPADAVAAADVLMYEVKRKGKGAVGFGVQGATVGPQATA
jgi:diguanylate cyclase (GGDEF)-like protein